MFPFIYSWSTISASTTTVVVQDLKSKVYYFKLRACTNAGEGMTSHVVAIDTLACSQAPCPQCQPPQECTDAAPGNLNESHNNIVIRSYIYHNPSDCT